MTGRYLLDTNIVIALFKGESSVEERLAEVEAFTTWTVLGELYFGAHRSTRFNENVARVDDFAQTITILGCDRDTALQYGSIKEHLRAQGKPIPENDIWIAAVTRRNALTLVSRDSHFEAIADLDLVQW